MKPWTSVSVPRESAAFPPLCPCCLQADVSSQVVLPYSIMATDLSDEPASPPVQFVVPHCGRCSTRMQRARHWTAAGAILVAMAAGAVGIWNDLAVIPLLVGAVVLAFWVNEFCFSAVRILPRDDEHVDFRFRSAAYAAEFRRLNTEASPHRPASQDLSAKAATA